MGLIRVFCCLCVAAGAVGAWAAERVASGAVEYRFSGTGDRIAFDFFGPVGGPAWLEAGDLRGMVEGQTVSPGDVRLVGREATRQAMQLRYRHVRLPLEVEATYRGWGDTGVVTRELRLINRGSDTLHIEHLPSLSWNLPKGEYTLTYLYGGWGQERQVATEKLNGGSRVFGSDRGRSTNGFAPWFYLRNETLGLGFAAQLAWSGDWRMSFERLPGTADAPLKEQPLAVDLGMSFDFGGALALAPGERFALPRVAMTASAGDLDDAANQLHRFQRQFVFPRASTNDPPLVQFNSWYPFPGKLDVEQMKRCADIASRLGAEVFVLDAGWYNRKNWEGEMGDYVPDPVKFPDGLQELSNHVRAKGMKFGIWVEIEVLGAESKLFMEHPEWCFRLNGEPLRKGQRYHLDFSKPEVRAWARATMERLIRDYGLDWVKIDYNIDIGDRFDPEPQGERRGDALYRHLTAYYGWLDEMRAAHPNLVVENCSSGGLRFDIGILEHAHTTWLSDVVTPLPSVQLAYGCTLEFAPQACNHWMVGDKDNGTVDTTKPAGWWDFMFRVPMNGQFGISSRVFDWTPELTRRAAENVALYKRLRKALAGADVYHLTPPPDHNDPAGWMALEYVAADRGHAVLMAYRLGRSNTTEVFRLRGLDPARTYRVTVEGRAAGAFHGTALEKEGLPVTLTGEWRSAVVEIESVR